MRPLRAVLCVDDQRLAHRIEESILEPFVQQGARILHAYDGLQALKMMAEHSDIDLVLLDINMPILNGLAFLDQKQKTHFASVPVIVLATEGERRDEAEHALSLGATRVLSKPFGYDDLHACIESIFAEDRRRAERHALEIPIELKDGTGVTRDVSGLGVYFSASFPFERDEEIDFILRVPDEVAVRCSGRVVRVDFDRESMRYGVAVTIDDFDVADADQSETRKPSMVLRELRKHRRAD
jgi:CheY-like chemotaxis protein